MPQAPAYNALAALRARLSPSNYTPQLGPEGGAEAVGVSRANAPTNVYDQLARRQDEERIAQADATQRAEVEAIRGAQVGARMRGFDDPQAEAGYGRVVEQQKLRQPLDVARVQSQTAIDRLLANQSSQDARTQAQIESRESIADANRTAPSRVSPALGAQELKALQESREGYRSRVGGIVPDWMQGVTGRRDRYMEQLTNALRRSGSLDGILEVANQTAAEGKSADDALAEAQAQGITLDPTEIEAFRLFVEQFSGAR